MTVHRKKKSQLLFILACFLKVWHQGSLDAALTWKNALPLRKQLPQSTTVSRLVKFCTHLTAGPWKLVRIEGKMESDLWVKIVANLQLLFRGWGWSWHPVSLNRWRGESHPGCFTSQGSQGSLSCQGSVQRRWLQKFGYRKNCNSWKGVLHR